MATLTSLDLAGVARYISSGQCKRIAFLTGAGASVAAGIPDFRSKRGLYAQGYDRRFNLKRPEDLFDAYYVEHRLRRRDELGKAMQPTTHCGADSH